MGKRFVRKTLGVRTLCWVLAVVLAVGGCPLPALQGLVRTQAARAEELELVDDLELAPTSNEETGTLIQNDGARIDYENDREWDRDMLPGWDGEVHQWYTARVWNDEKPYGSNEDYEVLDVVSSDSSVVSVEREGDDASHSWRYRAHEHGTATLTVTYQEIDSNKTGSYSFDISVGTDVYDVNWNTNNVSLKENNNGSFAGLPGQSIVIDARAVNYHENGEDTFDGFTYDWSLEDNGAELAQITNVEDHEDGSCSATVTFNNNDSYREGRWLCEDVYVHLSVWKNNKTLERSIYLHLENEYPEIWIQETGATRINTNIPVGSTQEATPEVRYYVQDYAGTYTLGKVTRLRWGFDENAVRITYNGGVEVQNGEGIDIEDGNVPTFTITRLENWGTEVHLNADWEPVEDNGRFALLPADEGGTTPGWRHEHSIWFMDGLDYHLRFDNENSDAWATRSEDGTWSNAIDVTNGLWMNDDLASMNGMTIDLTVGTGEWGDDGFEWNQTFDEKSGVWDLSYEDGRPYIVVHGTKLAELGVKNVRVEARAMLGATELAGAENDWWVHLSERELDYDREWDRDLLPGWDGSVNGHRGVWVRDENHPDGENYEYRVTNVEVVDAKDADGKDVDWTQILEFHKDSDDEGNYWWYYRALELGTATLKVTYEIPKELGGGANSYTLNLFISTDVYDVDVWSDDWSDFALPGSRVELHAQGTHHRMDKEDTDEGLTYEWRVVEGADVGHIEVDKDDPQHATFVVNPMGPDKMGFDDLVHIRVYLHDGGEDSVAELGWAFWVRNMYDELWPTHLDRRMAAGSEIKVTPEMRKTDSDGSTVLDAEFQWDEVNTSKFSITDAEGNDVANSEGRVPAGTYTIRRLNGEGTDFTLRCWYTDGQGNEQYVDRRYNFDELDYHLRFDDENSNIWVTREEDGSHSNATDATNGLWISNELASVQGMALEFTVGTGEWGDDGFEWDQTFDNKSGVWDVVDEDGQKSVVVHGAKLAELGVEDVRVEARATLGTTELAGAENDWWVHLRERELDFSVEKNRDLLPTWDGVVDEYFDVWMRDEEHPDGETFWYQVTNVEVVRAEDANGNTVNNWGSLLELHKGSHWWYYRALDLGNVTLKATYTRPDEADGHTSSYNLELNIVSDEFHFEGHSTNQMGGFILPGETAEVWLQGYHEHAVKDGDSWRIEESTDGLGYEWSMEATYDGTAQMIEDANDPTHVTIRALVVEPKLPLPRAGAIVSAHLTYEGRGVARAGWAINFNDDFPTVLPTAINYDLDVEASTTIDPKLVRRYLDSNNKPLSEELHPNGLEYFWSYDPEVVRITDAAGNEVANNNWGKNDGDVAAGSGPYTITRLSDRETQLGLMLRWENGGELEYDGLFNGSYEAVYNLGRKLSCEDAGHALVHVPAKAATLSKTGNKEHWKCGRCGKLFWDEDGTQEATLEDVTIAKLINISGATITFPARTYNGTAQTTLPVVKMNGKTLAKDTDYTVSGTTKATKAGNYDVTVTGKGLYGGTAKGTYTIARKAQTISAANKSVAMGKTVDLGAKVTEGGGALSYKSSNTAIVKVSTKGIVTPVKVGKATITITAAAKGNYKATSKKVTVTVVQGTQTITVSDVECVTGKTVSLGAKTSGDGKLSYKSGNTGIATVNAQGVVTGKKAGTAKITITAAKTTNYKAATKTVTVKVAKANPIVAKATKSSLTVSYAAVKSKAVATANNVTVTKARGEVTYANTSSNAAAKKFAVNKTSGTVTIPKGTARGTYTIKVTATAAGNKDYVSGSATVTYKIVVK